MKNALQVVKQKTVAALKEISGDRIKEVTCHDQGESEKIVKVNLSYEYTTDDMLIWQKLLDRLERKLGKLPFPVVSPLYGITTGADKNAYGSLAHYLTEDKKSHQQAIADGETSNVERAIFVSLNIVDHWIALVLYINDQNTLCSAAYINSSAAIRILKQAWSGKITDKNNLIYGDIVTAYPECNGLQLRYFTHYIQTDGKGCGVLAFENGVKLLEALFSIHSGKPFELTPTICNEKAMLTLRFKHLQLLTGNEKETFYERQLANRPPNKSRHAIMKQLNSLPQLKKESKTVISLILALPQQDQEALRDAFLKKDSEEVAADHLERIRDVLAFKAVENDGRYKNILAAFCEQNSNLTNRMPLKSPFNDYQQLVMLGNALQNAMQEKLSTNRYRLQVSTSSRSCSSTTETGAGMKFTH